METVAPKNSPRVPDYFFIRNAGTSNMAALKGGAFTAGFIFMLDN